MDILDIVQQAVLVFIRKLSTFDPDKARLITYYTRDIRTNIQRFIADQAYTIRQGSVYLQSIAAQLSVAQRGLEKHLEGTPSDEEVARKANINPRTAQMTKEFTSPVIIPMPTNIGKETLLKGRILLALEKRLSYLTEEEFDNIIQCLYTGSSFTRRQIDMIRKGDYVGHTQ